ncbi:hypothetical protein T484DRAFT_1802776 [Baffinella frigidus]|nr:hypothetical protein T484DRAFT_1802776 [Cryptophyta sp. CCMP2293]
MVQTRPGWVRERFKALGLDGHFDFVDFWYAYVTYISRAYGITVGKTWVPAVVPLADYGNTALRQNINARWAYDEDAQAFKVMSTRAVAAGEEVLESYMVSSQKDNAQVAFMFGFVLPGNPISVKQLTSMECSRLSSVPQDEARASPLASASACPVTRAFTSLPAGLFHHLAVLDCGTALPATVLSRERERDASHRGDSSSHDSSSRDSSGELHPAHGAGNL